MGDLTSRLYRTAPPPPATVAVQNPVAAFLRLMGWLWVLARHDALVPREVTPLLPAVLALVPTAALAGVRIDVVDGKVLPGVR